MCSRECFTRDVPRPLEHSRRAGPRAQGSELRMTAGAQGGGGMVCTVQHNKQPWRGRVDGNWYGNECVASRVGENNDAGGRRRRSVRSGQRGGQEDRGGGRKDVSGNRGRVGALWNRAGGRMSLRGRVGEGGAAGVTLLGVSRNILCSCVWPG